MGLALGFLLFLFIPIFVIFLLSLGLVIIGFIKSSEKIVIRVFLLIIGFIGMAITAFPGYLLFSVIWELVTYSG